MLEVGNQHDGIAYRLHSLQQLDHGRRDFACRVNVAYTVYCLLQRYTVFVVVAAVVFI